MKIFFLNKTNVLICWKSSWLVIKKVCRMLVNSYGNKEHRCSYLSR